MGCNNTNKIFNKGAAIAARMQGSLFDVYRVCDYERPAIESHNWLREQYFYASKGDSYRAKATLGRNQYDASVDATELKRGDIFHDCNNEITYFIGEIRPNTAPLAIQCFNTFTAAKREWDKSTRTYEDTIIANSIPCNVQRDSAGSFDETRDTMSLPDSRLMWSIETWVEQGVLKINDELTLDTGHKAQIYDLFYHGQGLTIKCREIQENPTVE